MTGNAESLAAIDTADNVNIVIITNPLTPLESREVFPRAWENKPLSEYVTDLPGEWAISTSQHGNVDKKRLETTYPRKGEFVVVAPIVAGGSGGGGGKTVLRLVALVALTYFTAGIASGAIGGLFGSGVAAGAGATSFAGIAGATAGSVAASVGTQVAGSLIINSLLAPKAPDIDNSAGKATYGLDGPKTTSKEGLVVPVVAGEHWVAGNAVSMFNENYGDEEQFLNMLLALGEGEFESIEEILINEQPVANFTDLEFNTRLGTGDQEIIPWFNDIVVANNRNIKLPYWFDESHGSESARDSFRASSEATIASTLESAIAGDEVLVHTTTGPADRLRLDFALPAGQGRNRSDGDFDPVDAYVWVGYREAGTSDPFVPLGETYVPGQEGITPDSISPSAFKCDFGRKATKSARRRSFVSGPVDNTKRYEIRILNPWKDQETNDKITRIIFLTDVNEILADDITYPHTALLGMRVLLSDQLNGPPSVLCRVRGIKCQVYDAPTGTFIEEWSDNPAWIAYTCLTNDRWGGGIPESRMKLSYFREWAAFCEANDLKFNGVIPEGSNILDALKPVFKVGRAAPIRLGTRFAVSIEKQRPMSAMFGNGNIMKGSLKINWSSMADRANEVRVKYYDELDYNKQKTLIIENKSARERGDDPRSTELDLQGVVNREQAAREGVFALNMNKLTRTVIFDAPVESLTMSLGDVFGISYDMPEWGESGRFEAGNTDTVLKLDRPVTMESGNSYQIMVRHDQRQVYSGAINQILGNAVYIVGYDPADANHGRANRLVVDNVDYEILEPLSQNGNGHYGVLLSDATGISQTSHGKLRITDYIEAIDVVTEVGEQREVTLQSPITDVPETYDNFAFGKLEETVALYTCRAIRGDSDFKRTITGLEYRDDVFDDSLIDIPITEVPSDGIIPNVNFSGFSASLFKQENVYRYKVQGRWQVDEPNYDHSIVWVKINDEPWQRMGEAQYDFTVVAEHLDVVKYQIIPVNTAGNKPLRNTVDKHTFTVNLNDGRTLYPPMNVTATPGAGSFYLDWVGATEDEEGNVVPDPDRPGIFRVFMDSVGSIEDAPKTPEDAIDFAALSAVPWSEGAFPTAATTAATYFNATGLDVLSIYRVWVREIHPHYTDVKSDVAPSVAGLFVVTDQSGNVTEIADLFPDGIKQIHFNTELIEYYDNVIINKLDEITNITNQALVDLGVAMNEHDLDKARITSLESELSDPDSGMTAMAQAVSGLIVDTAAHDGSISSYSIRIDTLESTVNDPATGMAATSDALDLLTTRTTVAEGVIDTHSASITDLESTVNDPMTGVDANASAVDSLTTRVTQTENGVTAAADDITALQSAVTDLETNTGADSTAVQGLLTSVSTINGQLSALSASYTALNSTVGDYSADITQLQAAVDGIYAEWSIKTDVNGKIAGVQLKNDGSTADFVVLADVFKVQPTGGSQKQVFAVDSRDNKVYLAESIHGKVKSKNWDSSGGTQGFYIDGVTGNAWFNNITARGDIEARSLKAGQIMVETGNIQNGAATKGQGVFGTTRTYAASSQSFQHVASHSVDPRGGEIMAIFSATVTASNDWAGELAIKINGSQVETRPIKLRVGGGSINCNLPVMIKYIGQSYNGGTTVRVDCRNQGTHGSFTMTDCYLQVVGLRK